MMLLLTQAIQQRRLVRLIYNGRTRTVEPHVLGLLSNGREGALCWQVSPPIVGKDPWQVFELDKISSLRMIDAPMELPDEGRSPPGDTFSNTYVALFPMAASREPGMPIG